MPSSAVVEEHGPWSEASGGIGVDLPLPRSPRTVEEARSSAFDYDSDEAAGAVDMAIDGATGAVGANSGRLSLGERGRSTAAAPRPIPLKVTHVLVERPSRSPGSASARSPGSEAAATPMVREPAPRRPPETPTGARCPPLPEEVWARILLLALPGSTAGLGTLRALLRLGSAGGALWRATRRVPLALAFRDDEDLRRAEPLLVGRRLASLLTRGDADGERVLLGDIERCLKEGVPPALASHLENFDGSVTCSETLRYCPKLVTLSLRRGAMPRLYPSLLAGLRGLRELRISGFDSAALRDLPPAVTATLRAVSVRPTPVALRCAFDATLPHEALLDSLSVEGSFHSIASSAAAPVVTVPVADLVRRCRRACIEGRSAVLVLAPEDGERRAGEGSGAPGRAGAPAASPRDPSTPVADAGGTPLDPATPAADTAAPPGATDAPPTLPPRERALRAFARELLDSDGTRWRRLELRLLEGAFLTRSVPGEEQRRFWCVDPGELVGATLQEAEARGDGGRMDFTASLEIRRTSIFTHVVLTFERGRTGPE